jgi:protein SCO1/2
MIERIVTCGLTALAIALLTAGCGKSSSDTQPAKRSAATNSTVVTQMFFVKGVVKELKPDGKTVIIDHETIPNYMEKMTMPFDVKDPKELAGLSTNDQVHFRLVVTPDDGWIDQVTKVGFVLPAPPGQPQKSFRRVREVLPLKIGDAMPDYPFTNQLGQAISLGQFKGQALALTFIFTRCPFPDFCPRMLNSFSDAYKKLKEQPGGPQNWHMFSISFDVEFDTPATLKKYSERYTPDPRHWSFCTGALIEIDAITEQFGLTFSREGNTFNFNHNLRTVVIDAVGKVQRIFIGNEWKASELAEELVKAAAVK